MAQIGGFLQLSDRTVWFSERFTPEDFYKLDIEVNHNMQRDIVCYEPLAQLAIVKLLTQHIPAQRYALRISSLSDNKVQKLVSTPFSPPRLLWHFSWRNCASLRHLQEFIWMSPTSVVRQMFWLMPSLDGTFTHHQLKLPLNIVIG